MSLRPPKPRRPDRLRAASAASERPPYDPPHSPSKTGVNALMASGGGRTKSRWRLRERVGWRSALRLALCGPQGRGRGGQQAWLGRKVAAVDKAGQAWGFDDQPIGSGDLLVIGQILTLLSRHQIELDGTPSGGAAVDGGIGNVEARVACHRRT